jgi:hypothetical protein
MIRKFAAVCRCHKNGIVPAITFLIAMLAGTATIEAQQSQTEQPASSQAAAPAQQPQAQQSSSQQAGNEEATPEEIARPVKQKPYKNWTYNVGGGANMTGGTTNKFVRSGGATGDAGVARNFSQYFGFRADFQYDNLPLRQSALNAAQAPSGSSQVYTVMVNPIINVPATKDWGGYIVFGPAFLHRSGKLDSSTAVPGSSCDSFYLWWGPCNAGGLPLTGQFLKADQNEFAFDLGGGIARRVRGNLEIYAEIRLVHGSHDSRTTDYRPITLGVRW